MSVALIDLPIPTIQAAGLEAFGARAISERLLLVFTHHYFEVEERHLGSTSFDDGGDLFTLRLARLDSGLLLLRRLGFSPFLRNQSAIVVREPVFDDGVDLILVVDHFLGEFISQILL
jgi:hypothetical protein